MTYKDQPFYPEYMEKNYKTPPLCLCQSKLEQKFGILSPSKTFYIIACGGSDEEIRQANDWFMYWRRFKCYQRTLDKAGWKILYQDCRINRREMKTNEHYQQGPEADHQRR